MKNVKKKQKKRKKIASMKEVENATGKKEKWNPIVIQLQNNNKKECVEIRRYIR